MIEVWLYFEGEVVVFLFLHETQIVIILASIANDNLLNADSDTITERVSIVISPLSFSIITL